MYLLNFEQWISTVFVDALGATFVHSLWQALVALIICHIALSIAKKSSPAFRYNLLLSISLLLAGAVAITFFMQFRGNTPAVLITYVPLQNFLSDNNNSAMPVVVHSQKALSFIKDLFQKYQTVLISAWFIIFCIKWLRLSLGINYIKRITLFASTDVEIHWVEKLAQLQTKLGIKKAVRLLQSNLVKVPMTSGFFKPMIIVPVSLLSNIPAEMVESILLHELAHIRRRDYLINILQSAAETIFFFNPFVLKISSMIRDERENCCDSIAVEIVQNKVSYVEALMAFGEYTTHNAGPAMAFSGQKNYLLQRIKRILYNQNRKTGVMEKSILACGMILLLGLAVFSSVNGTEKLLPASFIDKIQNIVTDTVPDKSSKPGRREVKRAARQAKQQAKQAEKEAKVNAEAEVSEAVEKVQEAQEAMQEQVQKLQEAQEEIQEQMEKTIKVNQERVNDILKKNEYNFKQDFDIKVKPDLAKINEETKIRLKEAQVQLADVQVKLKNEIQTSLANVKANQVNLNKELKLALAQVDQQNFQLIAAKAAAQANVQMDSVTRQLKLNTHQFYLHNDEVKSILAFIVDNNIAKANEVKSFTLNENEFVVNGQKQSSSLHEKLKKLYIESAGDHINYSKSGNSTSISIQRNKSEEK
jgi:beta-lactamase regulating signal transducer with metallopeptidase domain